MFEDIALPQQNAALHTQKCTQMNKASDQDCIIRILTKVSTARGAKNGHKMNR